MDEKYAIMNTGIRLTAAPICLTDMHTIMLSITIAGNNHLCSPSSALSLSPHSCLFRPLSLSLSLSLSSFFHPSLSSFFHPSLSPAVVCQPGLQPVQSVCGAPEAASQPALLRAAPQIRVAALGSGPGQHPGEHPAQPALVRLHRYHQH